MKIVLILLSLIFLSINVTCKKEIDIQEDFSADIEYRLEQNSSEWRKRGIMNFSQKSNVKNYKSSVYVINEILSEDQHNEFKKECSLNGSYIVRIKIGANYYFSSTKMCDLINNSLKDKFMINSIVPTKSNNIISINYDVDYSNTKENSNNIFLSTVDFVDTVQSSIPLFPNEKEEAIKQAQAQEQQQPGFLQRYVYLFLIYSSGGLFLL